MSKTAEKIILHPAFLLSSGNICLAIVAMNWPVLILQIAAIVLIVIAIADAHQKNQPVILPFWILGVLNLGSAALGLVDGSGVHNYWFIAAFIGWGLGHFASAREIAGKSFPACPKTIVCNMFYYGLADIFAILASPAAYQFPVLFAVIGTFQSAFPESFQRFKLLPASRFLALGYFSSGILAAMTLQPQIGFAYLFWTLGYLAFEPELNKHFVQKFFIAGRA